MLSTQVGSFLVSVQSFHQTSCSLVLVTIHSKPIKQLLAWVLVFEAQLSFSTAFQLPLVYLHASTFEVHYFKSRSCQTRAQLRGSYPRYARLRGPLTGSIQQLCKLTKQLENCESNVGDNAEQDVLGLAGNVFRQQTFFMADSSVKRPLFWERK